MSDAPAIVLSPRDRWLKLASETVGASELAAILGADPRRGPFAIYASKLTKKLDEPEHSWLAFGRRVEGAILDGFADKTGIAVRHNGSTDMESWIHPDQKRLRATPDGLTEDPEPGTVEAKAVAYMKKEEWATDTPLPYQIQAQAQMGCTGRRVGYLVALMWGIYITDPVLVTPNRAFMDLALEAVSRFWWHVENKIPPEADAKVETRDAIRRLWPTDNGQAVALDQDVLELAQQWETHKLHEKDAKEAAEGLENKLRVSMGEAVIGYLPDRSSLVLRGSPVAAQLCLCGREVRAPYTRRALKRWLPQDLKKALKAAHKEK